jgi:enamine deaminase RidA (YjgF/YER057c/UK114 family)
MFERYTEQARRALFFARSEMSETGGSSIDTAHLLAGILSDAKGAVRAIIGGTDITYADVREQLRHNATGPKRPTSEEAPFADEAKRALHRAMVEADQLRHPYIGAEHLLIAILKDANSKGGSIAHAHGLTAEDAMRHLRQLLNEPDGSSAPRVPPLPPLPAPAGNYVHATRVGNLVFLAGKGAGGTTGKVGHGISVEEAYQIARATGLLLLAALQHELGALDRVLRIVKVTGFVNATPEFADHPKVINGCSDLFVEVFGDRGRHARSAIGVASLPGHIPIEIEAVVEVRPPGPGAGARVSLRGPD